MRVAFFTVLFLEHGGGLEKYYIETASNLTQIPPMKVDVVTMDDKFTLNIMKMLQVFYMTKIDMKLIFKEEIKDIKKKLGKARYYKINSIVNLRKKLQEYDVIYSKNEILEAFVLKFLVGYKNLPPIIFGCHTPLYYPSAISLQSKLHNFLYSSFIYKFLTSGVKVFHVTNTFDELYVRKLFPNKKINKIYNPLNLHELAKLSRQNNYILNLDKSKLNILWVGRLTEQKGIPELLWIINELNSKRYKDKIIFNIVGDGIPKFKKDILNLKEKWNNINYFGYIQYKYLSSFYRSNDIFISTSRWESFGLVLLEVQAFGLPVISFDISGPRDIIQNNKTGFLVKNKLDYVKKIIKIIDKQSVFQKTYIVKSIQERFEEKIIYKQLKELLEQVSDQGK